MARRSHRAISSRVPFQGGTLRAPGSGATARAIGGMWQRFRMPLTVASMRPPVSAPDSFSGHRVEHGSCAFRPFGLIQKDQKMRSLATLGTGAAGNPARPALRKRRAINSSRLRRASESIARSSLPPLRPRDAGFTCGYLRCFAAPVHERPAYLRLVGKKSSARRPNRPKGRSRSELFHDGRRPPDSVPTSRSSRSPCR
jgi:hypothetical protein